MLAKSPSSLPMPPIMSPTAPRHAMFVPFPFLPSMTCLCTLPINSLCGHLIQSGMLSMLKISCCRHPLTLCAAHPLPPSGTPHLHPSLFSFFASSTASFPLFFFVAVTLSPHPLLLPFLVFLPSMRAKVSLDKDSVVEVIECYINTEMTWACSPATPLLLPPHHTQAPLSLWSLSGFPAPTQNSKNHQSVAQTDRCHCPGH